MSNDLKYDSERDLRDIGANNIDVHALNKVIICILSKVAKKDSKFIINTHDEKAN